MKKQKIYYDEASHLNDNRNAYEITLVFNNSVKELEGIIKKPIEDYQAFRNDAYKYAIEEIKKAFPKPFELGLDTESTLKMLSIDLQNIARNSEVLQTTAYRFVVSKEGKAEPCQDKEPYCYYIDTAEQFERLTYSNEIIKVSEKAMTLNPYLHKGNLITGFNMFVTLNYENEYIPNWRYVYYGITVN